VLVGVAVLVIAVLRESVVSRLGVLIFPVLALSRALTCSVRKQQLQWCHYISSLL
jgi:hypothetical protein